MLAKIAASEVPAVSGPPTVLQEQLAAAAEHRRHARWHRLSPLLDALEERAEEELRRARESLTAVTAPLAVRAELRGRLDAYRAKVARHGLAEDPLLVERYDTARRMLWSAPCDLRPPNRPSCATSRRRRSRWCPRTGPSRRTGPRRRGRRTHEPDRSRVRSPGCPGAYEDMGGGELYCDTCGLAPVGSAAAGAEELVSPRRG